MNATHSGNGLKYVYKQINKYLILAEKSSGFAYGEYVKDVVVKVTNGDFSEVDIPKVKIWFKIDEDKIDFVKEVLKKNPCAEDIKNCECNFNYGLEIKDKYGDIIVYFDLNVKDKFPDSGFDIFNLSWNPATKKITCYGNSLSTTRKNIMEKKAIICNSFLYANSERCDDINKFKYCLYNKILKKGYTIFAYDNGTLKQVSLYINGIKLSNILKFDIFNECCKTWTLE